MKKGDIYRHPSLIFLVLDEDGTSVIIGNRVGFMGIIKKNLQDYEYLGNVQDNFIQFAKKLTDGEDA